MIESELMNAEARVGRGDLESAFQSRLGEAVLNRMREVPLETVANEKKAKGGSMSIYVHVPFCTEICSFCAFRLWGQFDQKLYSGSSNWYRLRNLFFNLQRRATFSRLE